jgi:tRNA threonylcarbamoyladenosine biosynthesis protein TsaB
MQIAIDTSTEIAGLALTRDGKVLAELTWRCGQNHTVQLLPGLSFLLKQEKLTIGEADGIIVARGPGSYNGLRVGLGTAKGLAYSLNIPLVGISTLEVEAYQAVSGSPGWPVCSILNAGRGEIAVAVYNGIKTDWKQIVPEHITTVTSLCSEIVTTTLFCGEYVPVVAPEISSILGNKAVLVSGVAAVRRAAFLAELGNKRLQSHDYDDAATLQPLYLRAPPITQPKEPYEGHKSQ